VKRLRFNYLILTLYKSTYLLTYCLIVVAITERRKLWDDDCWAEPTSHWSQFLQLNSCL